MALCLIEFVLQRNSGVFQECKTAVLQTQWMLLVCVAIWCGTFLWLTFSLRDLCLIGLLLIAIVAYFIGYATRPGTDAITLLFGATLGKGAMVLLNADCGLRIVKCKSTSEAGFEIRNPKSEIRSFLVGLVGLLAFSSWWHLDMTDNFYHGPRWMGLWNDPNDYGVLMGTGVVLALGMVAARRWEMGDGKSDTDSSPRPSPRLARRGGNFLRPLRYFAAIDSVILFIAAGMMGVGLLFSYSRGAWVGTAIGLLYLAKAHGKFKWHFVLPGIFAVASVAWFFWNATPDTAPWYVKRLDLGRPSAQRRVMAWNGASQIMLDYPFGVGWNRAVEIYEKYYSPPEDGAAAITTNDYLMLGTQLGWPGLICFVVYVGLRLGFGRWKLEARAEYETRNSEFGIKTAFRASALAMLTVFWFDGGLFKLATASVFWILLELGREDLYRGDREQ